VFAGAMQTDIAPANARIEAQAELRLKREKHSRRTLRKSMLNREIWIIAAARTAIGTFGGALRDIPLADLAITAVRGALERSRVPPDQVGHLVMGNVIPTERRDAYLSRVAAIGAGMPHETPAFNVNRLCGSVANGGLHERNTA
jgi:3-oxoacyl-[acyl-carrier-protein] synthase III